MTKDNDFEWDDQKSYFYEKLINEIHYSEDPYSIGYVEDENEELYLNNSKPTDPSMYVLPRNKKKHTREKTYLDFIIKKINQDEIKCFSNHKEAFKYAKKKTIEERKVQYIYKNSTKNSHIKVGIYVSRWPINGGIEKLINQ